MERLTIKDWPSCEKPRERLLKFGAGALSNAEILAILIGTGNSSETAVGVGQKVLSYGEKNYGSGMRFLEQGSVEEILSISGMGIAKATRLKAAVELSRRLGCPSDKTVFVRRGEDVYALLKAEIGALEKEHFLVIMLGSRNQVTGKEIVSVGTLDSSLVHPREVFKGPIKKSAAAVVLAHNHPSGDPTPSDDDLSVTKRLIDSGILLGISVVDHVVITKDKYVSIREKWPQYFM